MPGYRVFRMGANIHEQARAVLRQLRGPICTSIRGGCPLWTTARTSRPATSGQVAMTAPIPFRAEPEPPDPPIDTRLDEARALRNEAMQLSARLGYFMRHELAEMRAKVGYFNLLCHLSDRRKADRTSRR